ncbi:MAG: (Fe-S)-binding protein [Clostridiaceae bacterium]
MEASGRFGMRVHQAVSFSRAMMHTPRAEAVFFPGCALLTYDPALLQRMMTLLRRVEPTIALAAGCCGQPTKYLEPARFARRTEKLRRLLVQKGVQRVYTACPNCTRLLSDLNCASIIPVWGTLNRIATPEDLQDQHGEVFALHDPCPVRQDRAQQGAVRALLQKANVTVAEFPKNREKSMCCGNIAMFRAIDPAKSAVMRTGRLDEIPPSLPITSYCAGCVDAFSSEGRKTAHLVELLFGRSKSRGWGNRIQNTILSRKD